MKDNTFLIVSARLLIYAVKKLSCLFITVLSIIMIPVFLVARFTKKKVQIGIGPHPLLNNVYFAKALKLQGFSAETFIVGNPYFITNEFNHIYHRNSALFLLLRLVFRYECFYIYFNGSVLSMLQDRALCFLEPYLLRVSGVKVVVMPYGSDCQIFKYTNNKLFVDALSADYPFFCRRMQPFVERNVNRWIIHADAVIGSMDSVDYLHFWSHLRMCHFAIDTGRFTPRYYNSKTRKKTIRVLHAPNHMNVKGSYFIESAIRELISEGIPIEYVFVQRKPNDELISIIETCDIVVDQLVGGWHGMFALEAMACGKPVICYIRSDLEDLFVNAGVLKRNELPLISATTSTIKDVLSDLINRKNDWEDIGRQSRAYVEKRHSLEAVGKWYRDINCSIGIVPSVNEA